MTQRRLITWLIAATLAAAALSVVAGVAFAASVTCKPGPGDCNGTKSADVITGTPGKDRMHGFGGGDEMNGRGSSDKLSGGPGLDTIIPGSGRDRVFAGRGNDTIDSRDGQADSLSCGKGERDLVKADEVDAIGNSCEVKRVSK